MDTYTPNEFRTLLLHALDRTRVVAQREVAKPLPRDTLLVLGAFEQGHRASSVAEVLAWLYRDGAFPRVVVMGVRGIVDDKTLVVIIPSARPHVRDRALTVSHPPEMGPFNRVGFMVPHEVWQRPRPLARRDLEDAAAQWQARGTA